jgi:hypothetical protein
LSAHFRLAQLDFDVAEALDDRKPCAFLVRIAKDVGTINDCIVRLEESFFGAKVTLGLKQNFFAFKWRANELLPDHAGVQDKVGIEVPILVFFVTFVRDRRGGVVLTSGRHGL